MRRFRAGNFLYYWHGCKRGSIVSSQWNSDSWRNAPAIRSTVSWNRQSKKLIKWAKSHTIFFLLLNKSNLPKRVPWDKDNSFVGWFGYYLCCVVMLAAYYFVSGIYLTFFMAICADFGAFRRQFESIATDLNEDEKTKDSIAMKEVIGLLIKQHIFIKE